MFKKIFFVAICLLFVIPAFALAGEGSDTIGANKLLPQLRYSYTQNEFDTDLIVLNWLDWETKEHAIYLQLNWGVHEKVDIYGLIGTKIIAESIGKGYIPIILGETVTVDTDFSANFLLGLGVKGTFYRAESGFYLGGGVLFTYAVSDDDGYTKISSPTLGTINTKGYVKLKWTEWNITADLHAGYHIKNIGLTPYAGVEYRYTDGEAEATILGLITLTPEFEQKQPFGVFVGADYFLNDKIYFNVEGHMINRWGVDVGLGYLFDL